MAAFRNAGPGIDLNHPVQRNRTDPEPKFTKGVSQRRGEGGRDTSFQVGNGAMGTCPLLVSIEERGLKGGRTQRRGLHEEGLEGPRGRSEDEPAPEGRGQHLPLGRMLAKGDLDLPGPAPFHRPANPKGLDPPPPSLPATQEPIQKAVDGTMKGLPVADRVREIQTHPDGLRPVQGAYRIDVLPPGQGLEPGACGTEMAGQGTGGEIRQCAQGVNSQPIESLPSPSGEGQGPGRPGGQEAGQRLGRVGGNEDGGSRPGRRRRHAAPEGARSSPHAEGGDEGRGKDVEEELKSPVNLDGGRADQTIKAVHAQVKEPRSLRVQDRGQGRERLDHHGLGGGIVRRIGLKEGQPRTERHGAGHEHSGFHSGLPGPGRDLGHHLSPPRIRRGQEGHGGAVELRSSEQLQPELEGREPEGKGRAGRLHGRRKRNRCFFVPLAGARGRAGARQNIRDGSPARATRPSARGTNKNRNRR